MIKMLLTLLISNWLDVALVVMFLIMLAILIKRGKKEAVKRIVYALVVQAEKQLGSKTGTSKRAVVFAELYKRLPWVIRILFTQSDIEKMIDESLAELKKFLRNPNNNLLGYDQEHEKTGSINLNFETKG